MGHGFAGLARKKRGGKRVALFFIWAKIFKFKSGQSRVGSGQVIKFSPILSCLITPCWVGLVDLFGLFFFIFHWIVLGTTSWALSYSFIFGLFKTNFTPQERLFYYGYFLCITLLLKRVCGPTLGYIFYF